MSSESLGAPALEIDGLSKSYRTGFLGRARRPVLQDLSFNVERGEIFGYLGPNGSGKTTTIKVLVGLVFPDSGTVRVLSLPLHDASWRRRAGYLPEHPYFYDYLTGREYIDYAGRLFGLPSELRRERTRSLLDLVGLSQVADLPLRRFSKGMAQRLGIAQALVNDPDIVFLDEPMSGLDPIGRRLVRDVILELKQQGKTVLFSTHILPDAEALCDRVGLLRSGRLLKAGRLDEILDMHVSHLEVLVSGGASGLQELAGVRGRQALGERWKLEVEEKSLVSTLHAIEVNGGRILSVQQVRQSLEDYFFKELGDPGEASAWGAD